MLTGCFLDGIYHFLHSKKCSNCRGTFFELWERLLDNQFPYLIVTGQIFEITQCGVRSGIPYFWTLYHVRLHQFCNFEFLSPCLQDWWRFWSEPLRDFGTTANQSKSPNWSTLMCVLHWTCITLTPTLKRVGLQCQSPDTYRLRICVYSQPLSLKHEYRGCKNDLGGILYWFPRTSFTFVIMSSQLRFALYRYSTAQMDQCFVIRPTCRNPRFIPNSSCRNSNSSPSFMKMRNAWLEGIGL